MHSQIEDRACARLRIAQAPPMQMLRQIACVNEPCDKRAADAPRADHGPHRARQCAVPEVMVGRERDPCALASRDHVACVRQAGRERLLAQDVGAALRRGDRFRPVPLVRS